MYKGDGGILWLHFVWSNLVWTDCGELLEECRMGRINIILNII